MGLNGHTPEEQASDPANAMAGYDLRWRCPTGVRCAVYAQLIGEDQAGGLPSRLLGLYGVEAWSANARDRYLAEYAETGCNTPIGRSPARGCAYRNHAYPQGYTDASRWLGAGVGPDSRLLTLAWLDTSRDASMRFHIGKVGARIGSFAATGDRSTSGRMLGFSARRGFRWGRVGLTPEFDWLRIEAAGGRRTELRIGLTLQVELEAVDGGGLASR